MLKEAPQFFPSEMWDWIERQSAKDLPKLRLKYGRTEPYFTALAQVHARTAFAKKFPSLIARQWVFPSGLPLEQSSSEALALFKAQTLAQWLGDAGEQPRAVVDLTGGMGVDSWALGTIDAVAHRAIVEPQPQLCALYPFNLPSVHCLPTTAETALNDGSLDQWTSSHALKPSQILFFIDPDRRAKGSKVAKLVDAAPNLLSLQEHLLRRGRWVLSKHSPMASLEEMRQLNGLKALWVVQWRGENKEILALQEAGFEGEVALYATEVEPAVDLCRPFATYPLARGTSLWKKYLIQPGPALIKSGLHAQYAQEQGWSKHLCGMLYTTDELPQSHGLYKRYEVVSVGKPYKLELPSRELAIESVGFPDRAEQVRARLKAKEGRAWKLFAVGYGRTKEMILGKLMV